uniref:RNase H type-1 domain-containing protein n=1 Tax=Ditylenchus dipsaci TaxID=166011 RepID=A0A915D1Y2_9BILA
MVGMAAGVAKDSNSGKKSRHLQEITAATQANSTVTQIHFSGISDGRKWTSTASLVDSASQVDLYGILGAFSCRFRWTATASQAEFYGVLGGLLNRLRWTSMSSQVDFLSDSGGCKWTSAVTKMGFHGISGGHLRHNWRTSTASYVDSHGVSGGLSRISHILLWRSRWALTPIQVDIYGIIGEFYGISGGRLRYLRWSSSATQVDLYGISGRLLWHGGWPSMASQVVFLSDPGGRGLLKHFKWNSTSAPLIDTLFRIIVWEAFNGSLDVLQQYFS